MIQKQMYANTEVVYVLKQDGDDFPCVRLQKKSCLPLNKAGSHNSPDEINFKCRKLLILAKNICFSAVYVSFFLRATVTFGSAING